MSEITAELIPVPHAIVEHRWLILGVAVRIRVRADSDTTLGQVGEPLLDWPQAVANSTFQAGTQQTGLLHATLNARPDSGLWRQCFPPSTVVRAPVRQDRAQQPIVSFPSAALQARFRDLYAAAAHVAPGGTPPSLAAIAREDERFRDIAGLIERYNPLEATYPAGLHSLVSEAERNAGLASEAAPMTVLLGRAALFHGASAVPRPAPGRPAPPRPDFHQLTALAAQHPALQRRLALTFELNIQWDERMGSGVWEIHVASGPLAGISRGWATAAEVDADAGRFMAVGGPDSRLDRGFLRFDRDLTLHQVDVDGAAAKLAAYLASAVAPAAGSAPPPQPLPTLRSAGIALADSARADWLAKRLAASDALAAQPRTLTADDLVAGWLVEVEDRGQWLSLNRRSLVLPGSPERLEELAGFMPAATQPPGSDSLHVHEDLLRWTGWSLVVARPGRAVSAGHDGHHLEDVVDPTADPAHDHPVFGAVSRRHQVPEKSLPVLRFGATYRLRVRALWLSGGIPDDRDDAPASDPIVYLRCEPYGPPGIRLDPATQPPASAATHGGTIETAVLLSGDNPAGPVTVWLTPPAAGIDLVEASGALDQLLRDDPARAYRLLAEHETPADAGFTPSPPTISYLADPELRGAVVENLPKWAGRAHYAIPASTGRAFLYFGGSWPAFGAARLVIRPGDSDWESDSATHEVRLSVPPAAELDLLVSADPPITNTLVLQWAPLAEAAKCWAVCPRRVLHVVHAVRRPLAGPFLREELPLDPPRRDDLPVAQRAPDQTSYAVMLDLKAHRPSTGSIDVNATWEEVSETDGHRDARATLAWREIIDQGGGPEPLPDDRIWFDARHELGDKKHRVITYSLTAISRFRAYFPDASTAPPADFTRPGTSLTVHLPATAAPPPPHIQRVVPAVRWSEESGSGWTRRTRRGNGVRLWLNGPWYVTGSGEVLAVVLSARGPDVDPEYAEKVTRLGGDPITLGVELPVIYPHWIEGGNDPATSFQNFPLDESPAVTGSTAETFWLHTVTPAWDKDRGLWYADVFLISPWDDYRPFLHLRVARLQPWGLYQPASNIDLRFSGITAVPPAQLLPSRTLEVRRAGQRIDVSLSAGASYFRLANAEARVEATFEQRTGNDDDPLAWRQLGNPTALTATGPWNQRAWTASLPLPAGGGALRVRVDEYEVYPGDGPEALRLAYTDAINLT